MDNVDYVDIGISKHLKDYDIIVVKSFFFLIQ